MVAVISPASRLAGTEDMPSSARNSAQDDFREKIRPRSQEAVSSEAPETCGVDIGPG